MSKDVECPYCGEELEICHDDGYGYKEGVVYTQTCGICNKTFTYTTSISFYYEAEKAPCQNGEPHSLKEIFGFPKELFAYKRRCEWCDEEVIIDNDKHKKAVESYFEYLKTKSAPKETEEAQKHLTTSQGSNK